MSRNLTAAVLAEIVKGTVRPVLIFKLVTDSGDVRIWNGLGDLIHNSEIYTGLGDLISVPQIKETESVQAVPFTVTLSGIPSSTISIVLGTQYKNRQASCWIGFLNDSGLIASPILAFHGRADTMVLDESPDTAVITFTAESRLADLKKPRIRRYTHEDQQQLHPGDLGLQFVTAIQNTEVTWGE